MNSLNHRKGIYAFVESLLGRALTVEEHEKLKDLMVEYLNDHEASLLSQIRGMEGKLRNLNGVKGLLVKKGVDKTQIEIFIASLNA